LAWQAPLPPDVVCSHCLKLLKLQVSIPEVREIEHHALSWAAAGALWNRSGIASVVTVAAAAKIVLIDILISMISLVDATLDVVWSDREEPCRNKCS
jgi:hypothetical protein